MKKIKKNLSLSTILSIISCSLLLLAPTTAFVLQIGNQQNKNNSIEQQDVDLHASAVNLNNTANAKDLDFNGFSKLPKKVFEGPRSADYAVALRNGNTAYINENKQITIIDENGNQIFESNLGINDTTIPLQIITNDYSGQIWYLFASDMSETNAFTLRLAIFNLDGKSITSNTTWFFSSLSRDNVFSKDNALEWYIKPIFYHGNLFIYRKYTNTIYVYGINDKNRLTTISTLTFPTYHTGDLALNIFGLRSVLSNRIYYVVLNKANNDQRGDRIATYNFYDTSPRYLGNCPIKDNSPRIWDVIYGNGSESLDVPQNMGFAYDEDDGNGRIRLYFSQSFVATKGSGTNLILTAAAFSVNDHQDQGINFGGYHHDRKVWVISNPSSEYDYDNLPRSNFDFDIDSVSHYRQIATKENANNTLFNLELLNPIVTFKNFSGGTSDNSGAYLTKELVFYSNKNNSKDIYHNKQPTTIDDYGSYLTIDNDGSYLIGNATDVIKNNSKPATIAPFYNIKNDQIDHSLKLFIDRSRYGNAKPNVINEKQVFSVFKNDTTIARTIPITLNKSADELTTSELSNLILQNLQNKIINSDPNNTIVNITNRAITKNTKKIPNDVSINLSFNVKNYFENNVFKSGSKALNIKFNVSYENDENNSPVLFNNQSFFIVEGNYIKKGEINSENLEAIYFAAPNQELRISPNLLLNGIDESKIRYEWRKTNSQSPNQIISNSKTLVLNNVQNNDFGLYTLKLKLGYHELLIKITLEKNDVILFNNRWPFIVEGDNIRTGEIDSEDLNASFFVTQNQKLLISPNLLFNGTDESNISYEWTKANSQNPNQIISNNKSLVFDVLKTDDFGLYTLKVTLGEHELLAKINLKKNNILPAHLEPKVEANTQATSFFVSASNVNKENALNYLLLKNIDASELIIDEVTSNEFLGIVEITCHLKSDTDNSLLQDANLFTVTISGFFSILYVIIGITAFVILTILIVIFSIYFAKRKAKNKQQQLLLKHQQQLILQQQQKLLQQRSIINNQPHQLAASVQKNVVTLPQKYQARVDQQAKLNSLSKQHIRPMINHPAKAPVQPKKLNVKSANVYLPKRKDPY